MEEQSQRPDYELEEYMEAAAPEQFKAYGDPTRRKIMALLRERAATTSQLAKALGQPVGGVGHHLKVLSGAGLVRVVRTRQVRAITEKYYGLVARSIYFTSRASESDMPPYRMLQLAMSEYAAEQPDNPSLPAHVSSHARIPASRAEEFAKKVEELSKEFDTEPVPGEQVYGFVAAVYLTNLPELPEERA